MRTLESQPGAVTIRFFFLIEKKIFFAHSQKHHLNLSGKITQKRGWGTDRLYKKPAEELSLALYAGLVGGKLCYSTDLQIEP